MASNQKGGPDVTPLYDVGPLMRPGSIGVVGVSASSPGAAALEVLGRYSLAIRALCHL